MTERGRIRAALDELRSTIRDAPNAALHKQHWVGFPGGRERCDVHALRRHGWFAAFGQAANRSWNAFGLASPDKVNTLPIIVEINLPWQGINRQVGGVLLEDTSDGRLLLAHRGRIGGGRVGVGRGSFRDYYRGKWIRAVDGDRECEVVPIAVLDRGDVLLRIGDFVREVDRIKSMATGGTRAPAGGADFTPEFEGRRAPALVGAGAEVLHGVIVRALAAELGGRGGLRVCNDRARDLFVSGSKRRGLRWLFEVKTNTDTQSIYAAIGQLLVHGATPNPVAEMFLVVPRDPTRRFIRTLDKLGIHVVTYRLVNNRVNFRGLPR